MNFQVHCIFCILHIMYCTSCVAILLSTRVKRVLRVICLREAGEILSQLANTGIINKEIKC